MHIPVMTKEVLEYLNTGQGKIFVDCTLGGGGHLEAMLSPLPSCPLELEERKRMGEGPGVRAFGIDQDKTAIEAAKKRLSKYKNIEYICDNFKNLKKHIKEPIDGILFDLGLSSYQIDTASRGFSLQKDGPLDMRMNQSQKLTAAEIINKCGREELERIFKEYGEERFSRRIARKIDEKRRTIDVKTTFQLKKIVEDAIPIWRKRESVTRIFQALRIAVNGELDSLKSALPQAIELLRPGGRIAVISYHSLEDRMVKNAFRKAKEEGRLRILTKKPLRPAAEEIALNPRAKSAKLRVGVKT